MFFDVNSCSLMLRLCLALSQSVKGCLTKQNPQMVPWNPEFGNTYETLDYNARPSSSSAAISGCHTSHITISRCALFLAQRRKIRSKFIVLQIVPHFGHQKNFFFAFPHATHMTCFVYFFRAPNWCFSAFHAPNRALFCLFSCSIIILFSAFFRAWYHAFFCNFSCAKSCLKSCYCNRAR